MDQVKALHACMQPAMHLQHTLLRCCHAMPAGMASSVVQVVDSHGLHASWWPVRTPISLQSASAMRPSEHV